MSDDKWTEKAAELLAALGFKAGHDEDWNMEKCVQFWAQALREAAEPLCEEILRLRNVEQIFMERIREEMNDR